MVQRLNLFEDGGGHGSWARGGSRLLKQNWKSPGEKMQKLHNISFSNGLLGETENVLGLITRRWNLFVALLNIRICRQENILKIF